MLNEKIFGSITEEEFSEKFSSNELCLKWISEKKWEGNYVCRKCGNTNYCNGKTLYSRRCTRCKSTESATAHTLFHHCRIPLTEAFKIVFEICKTPELSTRKLSSKVEIRSMTCWNLKKRLSQCIEKGGCDNVFGKINPKSYE